MPRTLALHFRLLRLSSFSTAFPYHLHLGACNLRGACGPRGGGTRPPAASCRGAQGESDASSSSQSRRNSSQWSTPWPAPTVFALSGTWRGHRGLRTLRRTMCKVVVQTPPFSSGLANPPWLPDICAECHATAPGAYDRTLASSSIEWQRDRSPIEWRRSLSKSGNP